MTLLKSVTSFQTPGNGQQLTDAQNLVEEGKLKEVTILRNLERQAKE